VSKNYQQSLYGDEWLLGLVDPNSIDLKGKNANKDGEPLEKLKYAITELGKLKDSLAGKWNANDAQKLADLLDYINRVAPSDSTPSDINKNNQKDVLKDFLTVYGVTQNDNLPGNGLGWDDIQIASSGDKEKIKQALFGDGTQADGLIDRNGLLLGGVTFGTKLTGDSLASIMGNRAGVDYSSWAGIINEAITKFDINTPKRLADFLANINAETGGLSDSDLTENTRWGQASLKNVGNFNKLAITMPNPSSQNYESRMANYLAHHVQDQIIYEGYLNGTLGVGDSIGEKQANYAYGDKDGNDDEESRDGYRYRGRGLLQITRKGKYERVTNGGYRAGGAEIPSNAIPGLKQIYGTDSDDFVANPEAITTHTNAARSSAWYWRYESSRGDLNIRADAGQFDLVVRGIHGNLSDINNRRANLAAANRVIGAPNAYGNINQMLSSLGINVKQADDYSDKFGVVLERRQPLNISGSPQSIIVDGIELHRSPMSSDKLINQLTQNFGLGSEGIDNMLQIDASHFDHQATVVLVSDNRKGTISSDEVYDETNVCTVVIRSLTDGSGTTYPNYSNILYPGVSAIEVFKPYASLHSSTDDLYTLDAVQDEASNSIKTIIVEKPKHGRLVWLGDKGSDANLGIINSYAYEPGDDNSGEDKISFITELAGYRIKVVYFIHVVDKTVNISERSEVEEKYCPIDTSAALQNGNSSNLVAMFRYIPVDIIYHPLTSLGNLTGIVIGETSGTGPSARITLDTDAAGYGWYIDYTPYLNDDYLPTSNPLEWVAKPGSAAAGKMDLFSVLMHEYGHAAGLEHSSDSHDLMASTLLPGVRRLPTAQELTTLSALLGGDIAPSSPDAPVTPPGSPWLMSYALFGFLRNRQQVSAQSSDGITQFDTVANPVLMNTALNDAANWSVTGSVTVQNGGATLTESADTQTRLNQVFVVGENDRYLSFTLNNIALDDVNNAPDDAFEVALLDASTGTSLLGDTGLSHNDALFNLQANGEEHKAAAVKTQQNADGSRTVLIDLAGIAAGTVVNLSFDLIGLGRGAAATSSHITVSKLRLGVPLEAHDDAVQLAEDSATDIAVTRNDIGTEQAGVVPVLITQPAHGTLTLTAEGNFRYLPEDNWFGDDSFSYQLFDGKFSSNVATVNIVVTPVNDSPLIAQQTILLDEDSQASINLLQGVTDVDGDALSVAIVTAPQHGQLTQNAEGNWTYTPDANWYGIEVVSYIVSDGTVAVPATLTLVVHAVNDAPVMAPQTITLDEDSQATFNLLQGVSDVDGDALSVAIVTAPQHGQLTQNADGNWTYTPDANWHGIEVVSYTVSDGTVAVPATLTLVVNSVNDAPEFRNLSAQLQEDGRVALDLMAAASDVDCDVLTLLPGQPAHGVLTQNAQGLWVYQPVANFNGEDTFTVTISDGQSSVTGLVRLTVTAVNDVPVVSNSVVTLDEDGQVTLSVMAHASDVDGDPLTLHLVSQPEHGLLVVNADQTVTYIPQANWSGTDSFVYRVNDGQADSADATIQITVNAQADAPVLVVTQHPGQQHELFRTDWESACDWNNTSTLVQRRELEGWRLITRPDGTCGGANGFEIWSNNDLMADAQGRLHRVSSATGNGANWLELNNAGGLMHQTLGIERTVETLAGATYTLSLDVAGRLGYGADYTRIGIYVDGVRMGGDESTSGAQALNWQQRTFSFTGNGKVQTIRIISEATKFDRGGRGMMLDNIALTEALPANTGLEDSSVALSVISAALRDTDGSETLTLSIGNIPVGVRLTDGSHVFMASAQDSVATVTGWDLTRLQLIPPVNFNGVCQLKVMATATEQANGAQATTEQTITVTVLPVNDVPVATDAHFTLPQRGSVVIDFAKLVSDADGDVLTLSLGNPKHGTLSRNADGTYTYVPKAGYVGDDVFTYTVSDGIESRTASIRLTVQNKPRDDDHHGHDCHRSASVIVQVGSHGCCDNRANDNDDRWENSAAHPVQCPVVNWSGALPDLFGSFRTENSLMSLSGHDKKSLAELTGLRVWLDK